MCVITFSALFRFVVRDSIFCRIQFCYAGFHILRDSVLFWGIQCLCAGFHFLHDSVLLWGIPFSAGFSFGVRYSIFCRIQFCSVGFDFTAGFYFLQD